jgi:hypothetical protein
VRDTVFLQIHSRGNDVKVWQQRLKLKPDGVFGPLTEAATNEFAATLAPERFQPGTVDQALWEAAGLTSYARRVPVPVNINKGVYPARQSTMLERFGIPSHTFTERCSGITNMALHSRMVTENVGPFTVTGLKMAVDSLKLIFIDVDMKKSKLMRSLSSGGMLCCRLVRGSTKNWSNHSWGTALDVKIDGMLDELDDGACQQGLLELAPFFNARGWYWGAGFSREDSMHFEAGEELVRKWSGG